MGATQVEISIHCPYCSKKETCESFQEIENLMETGWVIYRHTNCTKNASDVGTAGRSTNINSNAFILYNRKQQNMRTVDLLPQLDIQNIPCQRCRLKLEYAQKLINRSPTANRTNVVSVCDHCFLKMKAEGPCCKCENNITKFLAVHSEQEKDRNKYFQTKRQLIESNIEVKPKKTIQRSYSEINIYLPSQDIPKTVIKCQIQELFHSEQNLTDTHNDQSKHTKNQYLEKTVNFNDLIAIFHTPSPNREVKINKTDQDILYDNNELSGLKLSSISVAQHIRSSIAKTSHNQNKGEHRIDEEIETSYKNNLDAESEKSFVFPQTQQETTTNIKRYITSPELIQNMREKLRLKAEEEEQEKKKELERKAQEDEEKKLVHDVTRHKEDEQRRKEALKEIKIEDITSKEDKPRSLKPDPQNIVKYSKHKDDKVIHQETIKKQDIVDERKSLQESHLGENKFAKVHDETDKKKLLKSKETTQVKELPHSKIKEKFDKYRQMENTKETEKPMPAEEVNLSELKKLKDKGKTDKHNQLKNIEEKITLTPADKEKSSKLNKQENLKEKPPLMSKEKQDKEEGLKGSRKKRDSLHPIDTEQSEKANDLADSKQKNVKLNQVKLLKSSKDDLVAQMVKVNNKVVAKDLMKPKLPELPKAEEMKEIKSTEKKRDSLPTGKSEKVNNLVDSNQKDVKLNQVKLLKPSTGDLVTQMIKVNNKVHTKELIKTKVPELPQLEESKKEKSPDKKGANVQVILTDKAEKVNNVEDSKKKDFQLNQVILRKQSAGDLMTQFIKISNKVPEKDSIRPKLPELSKLIHETTKPKEKFVEKITSTPKPIFKDNTVDLSSRKEKQERELALNEVKLVESNLDNLILRLIKIKSTTEKGMKVPKTEVVKIKKRRRFRGATTQTEEEEESAEESSFAEPLNFSRDFEFAPPQREGQEIKPLYVQVQLSDISSLEAPTAFEESQPDPENLKKHEWISSTGAIQPSHRRATYEPQHSCCGLSLANVRPETMMQKHLTKPP